MRTSLYAGIGFVAFYSTVDVLAWSLGGSRDFKVSGRRSFLNELSSFGAFCFLFEPKGAIAQVPANVDLSGFDAYNIIPDSSASLDPKLERINSQKLVKRLSRSQGSLWLGEHHNSRSDHDFQEQFIRLLHKERTYGAESPMAIGLEQVQVQFQPVLDSYVNGGISLDEMRRLVEWDKRWMWDFDGYRGVFEAARDLQIRLLALNVDSEDLALVEKGGYPQLPMARLRKYIKDPVGFGAFAKARAFRTYADYVIEPSYEIHQRLGLLRYTITGEQLDTEMSFANFLSGRILWDEGMATAAHTWVSENKGGLLVGLVGADHVKFRDGIPGRFSRMSGNEYECSTLIINPTLIDSRPSGSVANVEGSSSSKTPDVLTLQLRYLQDGVDENSDVRRLPESTGGVLPLADYIVVTS